MHLIRPSLHSIILSDLSLEYFSQSHSTAVLVDLDAHFKAVQNLRSKILLRGSDFWQMYLCNYTGQLLKILST